MIVLGVHTGHDGGVAVVRDGKLVFALSSERLNRHKKTHGICDGMFDLMFAELSLSVNDIDAVALSDWHQTYAFGHIDVQEYGRPIPCTWNMVFDDNVPQYDVILRGRTIRGYNVGHQMSHCAAAYYTSPFPDALCLSMDASGGELQSNSLIAHGVDGKLNAVKCPGLMIGLAYGFVCEYLGLGSQMFKAGAMMGLASYGKPMARFMNEQERRINDCFFHMNTGQQYRAWVETLWSELSGRPERSYFDPSQKDGQQAIEIAATAQWLFEEAILHCVTNQMDNPNICLGGGSFLNCNVNSRIMQAGKNVHLFPAASDDGCAAGAALFVAHHILNETRATYAARDIAYLGPQRPEVVPDLPRVAKAIADGKVVGWFQGRSECGPRALGNRSILADPRSPTMRDHINTHVKHREWFRPLAPSVLAEKCGEWFDFTGSSPFMLLTAKVKNQAAIPAVTHVDGSSRMQTVTRELNPNYYDLISEFDKLTGVPMVLNTSLNDTGRPLAETEEDARQMFANMKLDMLVLNGEILTKEQS